MRNSVVQVSGEGFILTARAKGLKERKVLFTHVFRNALLPLVTVIALDFGFMFSGVLLVEIVFSWGGMGTLIYDAVLARDYPLLNGCFLIKMQKVKGKMQSAKCKMKTAKTLFKVFYLFIIQK
jgi:peptide/nickel transport system permease protein